MPVRFGIIGFGKMGQTRAGAIQRDGRGQVVVAYDLPGEPVGDFSRAESIEAIIQDPAVDAVCICLPNWLNKPTTIAALEAGKHVFCEKPPAFTAADVEEIIAVEKRSGGRLMYGFNHRHHAGVLKMKEIIDSGAYGKPLWMRGRYGKSVDANYLRSWRAKRELSGGGILLDQGIHMLDLCLFISGKPFDEVHALVSSRYWNIPGIEDNVFAILRCRASGLEVSLHSTMTQWRHLFSLEVFMQRGYLVLNGLKTSSNTYGEEILTVAKNRTETPAARWEDEERLTFATDTSWDREMTMFVDAVTLGLPITMGTSQHALDVMQLIGRIYQNEHAISDTLYDDLTSVTR